MEISLTDLVRAYCLSTGRAYNGHYLRYCENINEELVVLVEPPICVYSPEEEEIVAERCKICGEGI